MTITQHIRRLALVLLTGLSLFGLGSGAAIVTGSLTSAQAQIPAESQAALEAYGHWERHPRWGDVWVPDGVSPDWRPYTVGHWVYTDDWGWYWVSDDEEADWGWVTYHYGRWLFDRQLGWFWVPGDEWGPAWVNWRRGDNAVGWAPLPPDDVMYDYDDDPGYWVFVEPRYMVEPRMRRFYLPPQRTVIVLRTTVVVNRSFRTRQGTRIAINPGISPAVIAAASHRPVPTFRVQPRVFASTQGVAGAVAVRPQDLRARGAPRGPTPVINVQRTTTLIQPTATVPKAQPLGHEPGRLGTHPPRAAQGAGPAPVTPPPNTAQPPRPATAAPSAQPPHSAPVAPTPPSGATPQVHDRQFTPQAPPPPPRHEPPPPQRPTTPPPQPPVTHAPPRPPPPPHPAPPPPPQMRQPAPPPPQVRQAPPPAQRPPQAAPQKPAKQPPPKKPGEQQQNPPK